MPSHSLEKDSDDTGGTAGTGGAASTGGTDDARRTANSYVDVANSPEFNELRRTFRRFVFPMSGLFLGWYLVFVLLSNYAGDFMGTSVIGNIHVGLVIGLLQFVSTFAITMIYARWADRRFDPAAADLAARVDLSGIKQ